MEGSEARTRAEQGFDMISIITDVEILAKGMSLELDAARGKEIEDEG
jgi:4-hydroxy-2-oxoheptanedioate aldolase